MPFDAGGVFQRLYSWLSDRDAGIKILAERMDNETDGIVDAINDILQGNVAFKGPLKNVQGTAANPAYTFAGETGDGLFRKTDGSIGVSVSGTEVGAFPASFFTGIANHHAATNNPHGVTAAQAGALPSVGGALSGALRVTGGSLAGSGLSQHYDGAGGHMQSYGGLPLIFNELGSPVLVGYTAPGSAGDNDLAVKGGLFLGGTNAVNRLADYEEGSWLPSLGGTGGVTGQAYQTQIGRYVKIGKMVHLQATIQLSAKGTFTGSYVCLHGLPFAPHTATYSTLNVSYMSGMAAAVEAPGIYINPGSVVPYFIGTSGNSRTTDGFPQSAIADTSFVMIGGSYIANVQ